MRAEDHEDGHNEHQRVWTLLPWVANDTANAEQRHAVQLHLASCGQCRAELERERRMQVALAVPARRSPDVDQGFQRLLRRLDNEADLATSRSGRTWWLRLRKLTGPGLLGVGLVEVVALAVLLTTGGGRQGFETAPTGPAAYRTLSEVDRAVPGNARLRLVFDGEHQVHELVGLLQARGLVIVGGPSEAGVWSIGFAHGEGDAEAVARDLRSVAGVLFAEPVGLPQP